MRQICGDANVSFPEVDSQLSAFSKGGSGSGTVNHIPALNGGAAIHTGRSRLDGCCALFGGHSVQSLELRQTASSRRSPAHLNLPGRYYEGLFVICPLELKREFDQLDLTEGERNECVWNSPSRKAYGRSERAVHGLRTE
jgi:hypothetical protein